MYSVTRYGLPCVLTFLGSIKPTLRELNETLHTLNDFMKTTDKGIGKVKGAMEDAFGASAATFSKLKFLSGSLVTGLYKGFSTVLKLLKK